MYAPGLRPLPIVLLSLVPLLLALAGIQPAGQDALTFLAAARVADTAGWEGVYPAFSAEQGVPVARPALREATHRLAPALPPEAIAPYVAPPMGVALAVPFTALDPRWFTALCSVLSLCGAGFALSLLDRIADPTGARSWMLTVCCVAFMALAGLHTLPCGNTGPAMTLAVLAFLPPGPPGDAVRTGGRWLGAAALGLLVCFKGFPLLLAGLLVLVDRRLAAIALGIPIGAALVTSLRWGAPPFVAYVQAIPVIRHMGHLPMAVYGGVPLLVPGAPASLGLWLGARRTRKEAPLDVGATPERPLLRTAVAALVLLGSGPVVWWHYTPLLCVLALGVLSAGGLSASPWFRAAYATCVGACLLGLLSIVDGHQAPWSRGFFVAFYLLSCLALASVPGEPGGIRAGDR